MDRITNGHFGEPGELNATDEELSNTEIFRADITDKGLARVAELGNPMRSTETPGSPTRPNREGEIIRRGCHEVVNILGDRAETDAGLEGKQVYARPRRIVEAFTWQPKK